MSQLTIPPKPSPADPFAIGWREVTRRLADGSTALEQIPLTLEDALHPQEDDKLPKDTWHARDHGYLLNAIRHKLSHDRHALVLGDCKVLWEDGVHHSPDIAVTLGVREVRECYSAFDVAAEGVRPALIVEVVTPSTRVNDCKTKVEHYCRNRVPLYVIIDRTDSTPRTRLVGYEYDAGRYRPLAAEPDGRLRLASIDMVLGLRQERVVAFDGTTGRELLDYVALSAALTDARRRANDAEVYADAVRRRIAAEARIRELEAELRRTQPLPHERPSDADPP